jgi:putative oxidoreductase
VNRLDAQEWAPVPLRLVLGGGLLFHGGIKLFAAGGHANISHLIGALGVPFADLLGWITGVIEFGGGLAMLVGLWTRFAAAINALNVAVLLVLAAFRGAIPEPLPGGDPLPHVEFAALILAGTLALTLIGGGRWSLDRRRAPRSEIPLRAGSPGNPNDGGSDRTPGRARC